MTFAEMKKKVLAAVVEAKLDFEYVALRFEDKLRDVGDVCECSRHNPDRIDERDFPAFGSEEYETLPELDGTSGWELHVDDASEHAWKTPYDSWGDEVKPLVHFGVAHCYVIAGNEVGAHDDADVGEIVIRNAEVVAVLF